MKILGFDAPRLWNTSTFVMPDFENLRYVSKLDKLGFEVSTGSACSSGLSKQSSVPLAMGFSEAESKRLIRVSSYADQSEEDWQALALAFEQAREELGREASDSSIISL